MLFTSLSLLLPLCFFFTHPATPEIYTLSLHDALPIFDRHREGARPARRDARAHRRALRRLDAASRPRGPDRKSTRLNSSHVAISYAVFCLKKKKTNIKTYNLNTNCNTVTFK